MKRRPEIRQILELEESWLLPLKGQLVDRCYTYPGLILDLEGEGRSYHLRLNGDAVLRADDGEVHHIVAERWAEDKPELVAPFRGKVVEEGLAHKDGRFELRFKDGSMLEILADQDYEAWEMVGTGDLRVISTPGGELAIWKAEEDA